MESVVLLSQRKAEDSPEAETGQDGLAATGAETTAAYEEIRKYVAEFPWIKQIMEPPIGALSGGKKRRSSCLK